MDATSAWLDTCPYLMDWLDTNNTQCNMYQFFYAWYRHYLLQKTFRTWRGRAHIYRWFQQAMLPQLRTNTSTARTMLPYMQSQHAFYEYNFPIRRDLQGQNIHTTGDTRLPILFDSVGLTFHLQRPVQDARSTSHNATLQLGNRPHRNTVLAASILQRTDRIRTQSLSHYLSIPRNDSYHAYRNLPTYRFPSTTWSTARSQILYRRQTGHPNDTPSSSDSDTNQNID